LVPVESDIPPVSSPTIDRNFVDGTGSGVEGHYAAKNASVGIHIIIFRWRSVGLQNYC
jgi:hypothetical protein